MTNYLPSKYSYLFHLRKLNVNFYMCGRYTYTQIPELDEDAVVFPDGKDIPLIPRHNIAPTNYAPVIIQQAPRKIHFYRWGLIPYWAKDEKIGYKLINARSETLLEKPSFRDSVSARRCLVPADSFYEWKKIMDGKQPYRIGTTDFQPFYMAGLTSEWRAQDGSMIHTYTILTTSANEMMEGLHDRMPVILNRSDAVKWLSPSTDSARLIEELCRPFSSNKMDAYPVSSLVGNVRNDDEGLIERLN